MKRPFYIFSNGRLQRRQNTLLLNRKDYQRQPGAAPDDNGVPPDAPKAGRSPFPVEQTESIHLFGEIDLNTKLITFLAQKHIPVFCFDYYGNFTATLYPRDYLLSGRVKIAQAKHYLTQKRRLVIAREFVATALHNILRVLKYYAGRLTAAQAGEIPAAIAFIEQQTARVALTESIQELMGVEGNSREMYYRCWPAILGEAGRAFPFARRERNPPSNELNALISFGNAMCYSTVIRQIYRTALDPTLSFLHEPGERRFSLALDIAEIFKPLLVDRAIFNVIKKGMIQPRHFEPQLGGTYLNDAGRRVFVEYWDGRLRKTIRHRSLNKNVSYERLIRIECYRLIKHLINPREEPYRGFRMWW